VLSADGEVTLSRRNHWSREGGGVCPADGLLGIGTGRVCRRRLGVITAAGRQATGAHGTAEGDCGIA
jgi:hypothetical protein